MNEILNEIVKSAFGAVGLEVRRKLADTKPWDTAFAQWIAPAEATGEDPNDIGDVAWDGDPSLGAREFLLPHITAQSVVLELGPGTGRVTRHILPYCKTMVLVDYSHLVCQWLDRYLKGKGSYEIHQIDGPTLSGVSPESVDVAFAYGVFEHVDLDDFYCFLTEFHRVLRGRGLGWFNFDTLMSDGGLTWFKQERGRLRPGVRSIFRFYHPEMIERLAKSVGFEVTKVHADTGRLISFELRKE